MMDIDEIDPLPHLFCKTFNGYNSLNIQYFKLIFSFSSTMSFYLLIIIRSALICSMCEHSCLGIIYRLG